MTLRLPKRRERALVADVVGIVRETLGMVMPPESCPFDFIDVEEEGPLREEYHKARRENRTWRWKIAGAVFILLGFSSWVIFMSGYTRAEDVDEKITAAINPVQQEMTQIKVMVLSTQTSNQELSKAIFEQLAAREADTICRKLLDQKKVTDYMERRRLRGEADQAQERYKGYKKEYYPESRCEV